MSDYNPQRKRNLFDPTSSKPFKLSRSKIELFLRCPRCFYLDRRLGVSPPPPWPYSLNSAVGALLEKEFDIYRKAGKPHPLMLAATKERKLPACIPFSHPDLTIWRDGFRRGVSYHHKPTNLIVFGGVDDVWQGLGSQELIIPDYKSTAQKEPVDLSDHRYDRYKKQIEIYQWIFRKLGFLVSKTGCFVFANAKQSEPKLNGKILFDLQILTFQSDDRWIEPTLIQIRDLLMQDVIPAQSEECDQCKYLEIVLGILK